MPPKPKRSPRLDAAEVAAITWLADLVGREGLAGASAGNARLALGAACRRVARNDAAREALVAAVTESDPSRTETRLAAVHQALAETAQSTRHRYVIPHAKHPPPARTRAADGRSIPEADKLGRSRFPDRS